MNLETAKHKFNDLLTEIQDNSTRNQFLEWIYSIQTQNEADEFESADENLKKIADDLRLRLPSTGLISSEIILPPAAIDVAHTIHVDSFLYDDDVMDEFFAAGKISKYYCSKCECRNIKPLNIISHSMSREKLSFIFQSLLPRLENKMVIDVGSRVGAVIFAGYFYSKASKIVGIEMNTKFCNLQNYVIDKYNMRGRITVINDDVINHPAEIANGDVVFLHNVFEYFLPKENEIKCWEFLRNNITKSGVLIVAVPDIRISLKNLKINGDEFLKTWLKKLPVSEILGENEKFSDVNDITLYSVI